MEYVHGVTLRRLLAQSAACRIRPLPLAANVRRLAGAHAEGVIHRDIKPETSSCSRAAMPSSPTSHRTAEQQRRVPADVARDGRRHAPLHGTRGPARTGTGRAPDVYAVGVVSTRSSPANAVHGYWFYRHRAQHSSNRYRRRAPTGPRCQRRSSASSCAVSKRIATRLCAHRRPRRRSAKRCATRRAGVGGATASRRACSAATRPALALACLVGSTSDGAAPAAHAQAHRSRPRVGWWRPPTCASVAISSAICRPRGRTSSAPVRSCGSESWRAGPWLELGVAGKVRSAATANGDNRLNSDNEHSDSLSVDAAWVKLSPLPAFRWSRAARAAAGLTPLVWGRRPATHRHRRCVARRRGCVRRRARLGRLVRARSPLPR